MTVYSGILVLYVPKISTPQEMIYNYSFLPLDAPAYSSHGKEKTNYLFMRSYLKKGNLEIVLNTPHLSWLGSPDAQQLRTTLTTPQLLKGDLLA
jgi:hypothetical protein